jgi:GTP cyclohydrolase I
VTNQIADALDEHLRPLGVGVLVRAAHHCMSTRGVRIHGAATTTSAMRGALRLDPAARAEFLSLCAQAERAP